MHTATINRDQRDGIYELVRNHLGGIGDIWIALEENKDFATAERLGLEFGEDFRLLADIGWQSDENRVDFELTMPPHDLMEVLGRLHDEAERLLTESPGERQSREEDAESDQRFQTGLDACEEVLIELDERAVSKRERRQAKASSPRRAGRPRSRLPGRAQGRRAADHHRDRQGHRPLSWSHRQLPRPTGEGQEGSSDQEAPTRLRPRGSEVAMCRR
jgi:hypothetical protein